MSSQTSILDSYESFKLSPTSSPNGIKREQSRRHSECFSFKLLNDTINEFKLKRRKEKLDKKTNSNLKLSNVSITTTTAQNSPYTSQNLSDFKQSSNNFLSPMMGNQELWRLRRNSAPSLKLSPSISECLCKNIKNSIVRVDSSNSQIR